MKLIAFVLSTLILASSASAQMGPTVSADDRSLACFSLSLYPAQVVYWAACVLSKGKENCGWARPSQYGDSAIQALRICTTGRPHKTLEQTLENKQQVNEQEQAAN